MSYAGDASGRWAQLDGKRQGLITRLERYAAWTIAKLCTPTGYKQNSQELSHDFQAVGAQAVNFLANKIMLALFAPSRPFFRLDALPELEQQLEEIGVTRDMMLDLMTKGEKEAVRQLDRMALRPKLYEAIKQLIVLGNTLVCLDSEDVRVIGIKNYCVRRSMSGRVMEIIIRDKVLFDELDPAVQEVALNWKGGYFENAKGREVCLYRWIKRNAVGDYEMTQWVDQNQLPSQFNGKWTEKTLPYRVLTWDLSDDAHYGTGLVEDYAGDFAGLSMMSKAQIQGALLASEFRWLVDPAGMTRPEDLAQSNNGDAIPGREGDVTIIQSGKAGDLQVVGVIGGEYIARIGRGFLLNSSVTRDAERVTAEEIRMQAQELETSLGGVYSRLAADFQLPLTRFLLILIDFDIEGSGIEPSIVTGMEALSRNGDLEDFKLWVGDMAAIAGLPPELLQRLKLDQVAAELAAPRRIDTKRFLKSNEELQQEADAARQQAMQDAAMAQGIQTAGTVAEQQSAQEQQ